MASPEEKTLANAESAYVAKRASALTNPITNDSIFVQADNSTLSAFVSIPGDFVSGTSRLDGKCIYVRASGKVITGASSTLITTLWFSPTARTSITFNGTGVATTGATHTSGAFATTSGNWFLEAVFTWDITSKILGGSFDAFSSATPSVTATTVCTAVTAVDLSVPGPGFLCGAHFGTSNAANIVSLSEFILEVL